MSPPLPIATAMEIARYVLPDADDATVSAAASTIGLFAANCVWQAMMQIAEEQAQKATAERARVVALLRAEAAGYEAKGKAADGANISSDKAWAAHDALVEMAARVEAGDG